ncbi:MAG: DUF2147 domain-containing protein [Bacteroidota bacterium]
MKFYLVAVLGLSALFTGAPSDAIIGEYWAEDKSGKIAIFKCDEQYCGRISWQADRRKDTKNPDPNKRDQEVIGTQFLNNFQYRAADKTWEGGTIYSVDDGKTYQGKLWLEDRGKTLKMRGFIGFSLVGKTATFKRVD